MSVQRVPSVVVAVVAWQRDMIGMRTVTWQRVTIGMRTDVIILTKPEGAREGTLQLFFVLRNKTRLPFGERFFCVRAQ